MNVQRIGRIFGCFSIHIYRYGMGIEFTSFTSKIFVIFQFQSILGCVEGIPYTACNWWNGHMFRNYVNSQKKYSIHKCDEHSHKTTKTKEVRRWVLFNINWLILNNESGNTRIDDTRDQKTNNSIFLINFNIFVSSKEWKIIDFTIKKKIVYYYR